MPASRPQHFIARAPSRPGHYASALPQLQRRINDDWPNLTKHAHSAIETLPSNAFNQAALHHAVDNTTIDLNTRLTSVAGRAFYYEHRIEISVPIFTNPANASRTGSLTGLDPLQSTLAHELAHVLQYATARPGQPHSPMWSFFDLLLGDDGERCHNLVMGDWATTQAHENVAAVLDFTI